MPPEAKRLKKGRSMFRMRSGVCVAALCLLPLAAEADTRQIRASIEADASVTIKNAAGSVLVTGTDTSELHVEAELGAGVEKLFFNESTSRPVIEVVAPRGARRIDSTLRISLPRGVDLEIRTVSAEIKVNGVQGEQWLYTVSGGIEATGGMGEIETETVSGNITIHGVHEEVRVETTSGSVQLAGEAETLEVRSVSGSMQSQMNVREMHVNTTSGAVIVGGAVHEFYGKSVSGRFSIAQATGEVRIETVSGTIAVVGNALREFEAESFSGRVEYSGVTTADVRMNLRTRSGDVRLSLPPETSATLKLSSLSGTIRCDFPGVQVIRPEFGPGSSVDATIGGGAGGIEVETLSGGIEVSRDGRVPATNPVEPAAH
jgi:DUF4097 and DUF4098 domain-containing protein YvlB